MAQPIDIWELRQAAEKMLVIKQAGLYPAFKDELLRQRRDAHIAVRNNAFNVRNFSQLPAELAKVLDAPEYLCLQVTNELYGVTDRSIALDLIDEFHIEARKRLFNRRFSARRQGNIR